MKKFVVTGVGLLLAISAASPNCWAVIKDFDNGGADGLFLTAANWNDAIGGDDDLVPGPADRALINAGFVVTYGTGATTTVGSLIVGADWPVTGDTGTPGTLNMSDGKLIVTGGGDNFQISRACCATEGSALNMTGDAELEIGGTDPIVGTRDQGTLDVGGTAKVYPTTGITNYWRLGNYGPSFDQTVMNPGGLQGNGLLNVHDSGSFSAHVIFIGDNDSTGELRVAGNGSVILTDNLVPRPSGFQAMGSALIHMIGSSATLSAVNLESESLAGEIPTKYVFDADVGGVSEIDLSNAVNITNNDLVVNLNGFPLPFGAPLLLFDAAPGQIYGTFASSVVNGSVVPHIVIYDNLNGDILVQRVPEPSTMLLLGLGMVMAISAKRRASR